MRKGWDDALELQNGLRHALKSDEYAAFLRWFSAGTGTGLTYVETQDAPYEGRMAETDMNFIAAFTATMAVEDDADPMWVGNDVIELVEYASETFKPELMSPEDLIVPHAFCVFERPLHATDTEGRDIAFRAASWRAVDDLASASQSITSGPGLNIGLWHHKDDEDAYLRAAPRPWGRRVAGTPLLLIQTTMSPWGEARFFPAQHELFAQLQVLWKLAQQRIAVISPERVSRPTWRSKQNWREIKTVQVFTLRRPSSVRYEGEPSGRGYSHRFPVRGHWRNQWYPSLKMHRQKWVTGYVKGPADKPFVAKRRAVEFIR